MTELFWIKKNTKAFLICWHISRRTIPRHYDIITRFLHFAFYIPISDNCLLLPWAYIYTAYSGSKIKRRLIDPMTAFIVMQFTRCSKNWRGYASILDEFQSAISKVRSKAKQITMARWSLDRISTVRIYTWTIYEMKATQMHYVQW